MNVSANRTIKRDWSLAMVLCTYLNAIAWGYLVFGIVKEQWLYGADFVVYLVLQILAGIVVVGNCFHIRMKKQEIIKENEYPVIVDDDQYWKKGWYENPNDKRLFVSDRICSSNYSINMARTAGKVMTGGLAVVVAAAFIMILGLGVQLLELDLNGVKVAFSEGKVIISDSLYHDTFDLNELEKVELKKTIPKDDYVRTNGADTDEYLLGHFRGKRLGNVMMFYNKKVECVLEIKVDGEVLFLNGHSEEETKEWYEKMLNEI